MPAAEVRSGPFKAAADNLEACRDVLNNCVGFIGLTPEDVAHAKRMISLCQHIATDFGELADES